MSRRSKFSLVTHIPSSSLFATYEGIGLSSGNFSRSDKLLSPGLFANSLSTNISFALESGGVNMLNSVTDIINGDSGEGLMTTGGVRASEGANRVETILDPAIEYMGQIAYNVVAPVIISFGVLSNVINLIVLSRPSLRGPTFR